MDRKEAIREKILGLGVDVCGFGGIERFAEAPINFRPTDLYPDCKSVIAVGIALIPCNLLHSSGVSRLTTLVPTIGLSFSCDVSVVLVPSSVMPVCCFLLPNMIGCS